MSGKKINFFIVKYQESQNAKYEAFTVKLADEGIKYSDEQQIINDAKLSASVTSASQINELSRSEIQDLKDGNPLGTRQSLFMRRNDYSKFRDESQKYLSEDNKALRERTIWESDFRSKICLTLDMANIDYGRTTPVDDKIVKAIRDKYPSINFSALKGMPLPEAIKKYYSINNSNIAENARRANGFKGNESILKNFDIEDAFDNIRNGEEKVKLMSVEAFDLLAKFDRYGNGIGNGDLQIAFADALGVPLKPNGEVPNEFYDRIIDKDFADAILAKYKLDMSNYIGYNVAQASNSIADDNDTLNNKEPGHVVTVSRNEVIRNNEAVLKRLSSK